MTHPSASAGEIHLPAKKIQQMFTREAPAPGDVSRKSRYAFWG
jgi:hypothetical protein